MQFFCKQKRSWHTLPQWAKWGTALGRVKDHSVGAICQAGWLHRLWRQVSLSLPPLHSLSFKTKSCLRSEQRAALDKQGNPLPVLKPFGSSSDPQSKKNAPPSPTCSCSIRHNTKPSVRVFLLSPSQLFFPPLSPFWSSSTHTFRFLAHSGKAHFTRWGSQQHTNPVLCRQTYANIRDKQHTHTDIQLLHQCLCYMEIASTYNCNHISTLNKNIFICCFFL